jgi:hypothetical protein
MSERSVRVDGAGPSYTARNSEVLAELALARTFAFTVYRRTAGDDDLDYDFMVAAADGSRCFVKVCGFSSYHLKLPNVVSVPELLWAINPGLVRKARRSSIPLVLFLFDADTEHGRFARLDTLPEPAANARQVLVRFPVENTITTEALIKMIAEMQHESAAAG